MLRPTACDHQPFPNPRGFRGSAFSLLCLHLSPPPRGRPGGQRNLRFRFCWSDRQSACRVAFCGKDPRRTVQSSLPLGITPDVEYAETTVQLNRGDKVTFLSDGVLEARSEAGGIFGFDRTREISRQSAREIAKAAMQYGQEDDITVLTLSFIHPDPVTYLIAASYELRANG